MASTNTRTRSTCSRNSSGAAVRISSSLILSACSDGCFAPLSSLARAVHAQEQVRRGPTSVSDFEVSLADIYTGASIDVRVLFPSPLYLSRPPPPITTKAMLTLTASPTSSSSKRTCSATTAAARAPHRTGTYTHVPTAAGAACGW